MIVSLLPSLVFTFMLASWEKGYLVAIIIFLIIGLFLLGFFLFWFKKGKINKKTVNFFSLISYSWFLIPSLILFWYLFYESLKAVIIQKDIYIFENAGILFQYYYFTVLFYLLFLFLNIFFALIIIWNILYRKYKIKSDEKNKISISEERRKIIANLKTYRYNLLASPLVIITTYFLIFVIDYSLCAISFLL